MKLKPEHKESLIGLAELTAGETEKTYGRFKFRGQWVRFAILSEFSLHDGPRLRYLFEHKSTRKHYGAVGRLCLGGCGRLHNIEFRELDKQT
jgi:hypothetical protein